MLDQVLSNQRPRTPNRLICLAIIALVPANVASGRPASIEEQVHSISSSMSRSEATALALASSDFQALVAGHSIQFGSIFTTWSIWRGNEPDRLELTTVNVVYYYYEADGSSTNVVATLNPSMTLVTSVSTQVNPLSSTQSSSNWSGYEMYASGTQKSVPVYEATSTWTVPYAHEPYSHACDGHHCDLYIEAGLTDNALFQSPTYAVKAGTDSGVYCQFGGCSEFYWSWYHFWPQPQVRCPAISQGDVIQADVVNDAIKGGSSAYWDIYLTDYGQGGTGNPVSLCGVIGNGFGVATPYYAQFYAERPWWGWPDNYNARLPNFGSFPQTTDLNHLSGEVTGYTAYSNGWYNQYVMSNGATNIMLSSVDGNSRYTQTWQTSNGT